MIVLVCVCVVYWWVCLVVWLGWLLWGWFVLCWIVWLLCLYWLRDCIWCWFCSLWLIVGLVCCCWGRRWSYWLVVGMSGCMMCIVKVVWLGDILCLGVGWLVCWCVIDLCCVWLGCCGFVWGFYIEGWWVLFIVVRIWLSFVCMLYMFCCVRGCSWLELCCLVWLVIFVVLGWIGCMLCCLV